MEGFYAAVDTPVRNEGFNLSDRLQEHRMLKGFYVTYVRQLMAHG
jgi:hypothetical protein